MRFSIITWVSIFIVGCSPAPEPLSEKDSGEPDAGSPDLTAGCPTTEEFDEVWVSIQANCGLPGCHGNPPGAATSVVWSDPASFADSFDTTMPSGLVWVAPCDPDGSDLYRYFADVDAHGGYPDAEPLAVPELRAWIGDGAQVFTCHAPDCP